MSPRVAQATGALGHSCSATSTASLGSWCDRNTGTTVYGSGEASSSSSSSSSSFSSTPRASAPPRDPVMMPAGEVPFVCRSASGLEDDVIAPDLDAAVHDCTSMTNEPCACHIPESARARAGDDVP